MSQQFDVVVIGGGPGGYVAAIRAAQLGFSTACVDATKNPEGKPSLGGTCLNVGCIPSKALLQSSENFHAVQHDFAKHGISVEGAQMDVAKMLARKNDIITKNAGGISFLFKKNKVANIHGLATLKARQNEKWAVPARLGVIGAGVIGLEMGSVWKRLGADVTILEAAPTFLGAADQQIAKEAFKTLTKDTGLDIKLGVKIGEITKADNGVVVNYELNGEAVKAEFDKLIVSIGRVPNTQGLGGANVNLQMDDRGFIVVDDHCHTNLPNVWAIGDVVRGPMLAHKASEEGVAVAERIAGLKAEGIEYKKGTSGFAANGRALGLGQAQGTVKILACAKTDRILGLHMIGPMVSELVTEGVVSMEFKAASEDLARIVHAHPSLSEVVHEAALAADKRALHG